MKLTFRYKFKDKEKFNGQSYCTLHNELCEDLSFACDTNCQIYEDYKQLKRKEEECEELKGLNTNLVHLLEYEFNRINSFLSKINILPISNSIRRFAKEKARLQKEGTPIEDFDLLIGVSAVENNLMLITDNIRHMSRINDILIENWR